MAHSIPDCVAVVLHTPGGTILHTGDYKIDHTPVDGLRTDVGKLADARKPRRRPAARRLDERRAPRRHPVGAHGRRGVPPDHPAAHGADPDDELRLEHPPRAAGGRRRRDDEPQGRDRRALAAQEREHLAQPRLPRGAGRHDPQAGRALGVPARPADDPLHREPGRADVRADADRLPRPPDDRDRARRHGDPVREAGARGTSCASTTRSTG